MRRVQAYTRTENEAESMRTHLITLGATDIEIGALDSPLGNDIMLMAPIPAPGQGSSYAGQPGYPQAGVVIADDVSDSRARVSNIIYEEDNNRRPLDDERVGAPDELMHVLAFTIEDSRFDEAMQEIRSRGGYVE